MLLLLLLFLLLQQQLLLLLLLLPLQFAWFEAARAGGFSGKLFVGQHLQQLEGEITLDYLPSGGDSLPQVPGNYVWGGCDKWILSLLSNILHTA
jgi:hypothetical protein